MGSISPYQRLIRALDQVLGELTRERHVRGVGLGDHEQTAGVFVEAVDNTRPERAPMLDSRCGQCATSALTSVPSGLPAPAWTTSPAGLSMTIRCSSS